MLIFIILAVNYSKVNKTKTKDPKYIPNIIIPVGVKTKKNRNRPKKTKMTKKNQKEPKKNRNRPKKMTKKNQKWPKKTRSHNIYQGGKCG